MKINIYKQIYNGNGEAINDKLVATFYNQDIAYRLFKELRRADADKMDIGYRLEESRND